MNLTAKFFDELSTGELYEILKARAEIFIMEQGIRYQDMDDVDYDCLHCFLMEEERVVAYFRAFYLDECEGVVKVGRVLTLEHGKGTGRVLLEQGLAAIRNRMRAGKVCMDAQKHAVGFYERLGFRITSEEFLEEGVVHVAMELELQSQL